ncbi:MAG: hypothetical protein FJZ56_00685 [Chlamydiae bacterium]|nr:hypothetical protein [Chlamydiota bacterium]
MKSTSIFLLSFFPLFLSANGDEAKMVPFKNQDWVKHLINSVDFHPSEPLFCVTLSGDQQVVIYKIDERKGVSVFQKLKNPTSKLSSPQHALFSKDGKSLIVSNWNTSVFNVYRLLGNGKYKIAPIHTILPENIESYRPHGMCFSNDGTLLAAAYGCSCDFSSAIVLYEVSDLEKESGKILYKDFVTREVFHDAIPKGISFSPDNRSLLVSYSNIPKIDVFDLDSETKTLIREPKQTVDLGNIYLPEDIKFLKDGTAFALSDSLNNQVHFFHFDNSSNTISEATPYFSMKNPESHFDFPHGLAFSPDGSFFAVTGFDQIQLRQSLHDQ